MDNARKDSMKLKRCSHCNDRKPRSEFYINRSKPDGLGTECKPCTLELTLRYKRTQSGCVTQIFAQQKKTSKARGHPLPAYTKIELRDWLYENGFFAMWCQWVWSGYDKWFAASVDRIDSAQPYSLANIQLVTWRTNSMNGAMDKKQSKGSSKGLCKPVLQTHESGEVVARFGSYREAARATGVRVSSISQSIKIGCRGGGYIWLREESAQ